MLLWVSIFGCCWVVASYGQEFGLAVDLKWYIGLCLQLILVYKCLSMTIISLWGDKYRTRSSHSINLYFFFLTFYDKLFCNEKSPEGRGMNFYIEILYCNWILSQRSCWFGMFFLFRMLLWPWFQWDQFHWDLLWRNCRCPQRNMALVVGFISRHWTIMLFLPIFKRS